MDCGRLVRLIGHSGVLLALLALLGLTCGLRPARAATITVTGDGDTVAVDQAVTLREAVVSINSGSAVNTDVVASGTYGVNDTINFKLPLPALIKLTSNAVLPILSDVTIVGPTSGVVAVDGNLATQVFSNPGSVLSIKSLTIQNGKITGNGGGIYNNGTLNLTNCVVSGNTASQDGGGIYNDGSGAATLINSTLSGNTATAGLGGGIYNNGTIVALTNCTFGNNTAGTDGGGVWNNGEMLSVTGTTFSDNKAPNGCGGGLFNGVPEVTVTNCTFSGNSASLGGGLCNQSEMTMANCTLSGNSASSLGGGIFNSDELTIINTIAANSTAGADCFNNGTITNDHNLIETDSGSGNQCSDGTHGDIIGSDPRLAPLGHYGGPTETFALCTAPGVPAPSCTGPSPAIDAGTDTVVGPPLNLTTDQRGLRRLFGLHVDIGSFEVQPLHEPAPALSTMALLFLAVLLGAFGWLRSGVRRTLR